MKERKENTPNPGSPAAVKQGCTCPVMDNCNGAGILIGGDVCFYYTSGCPLHGDAVLLMKALGTDKKETP
jgi:hypothetical protein